VIKPSRRSGMNWSPQGVKVLLVEGSRGKESEERQLGKGRGEAHLLRTTGTRSPYDLKVGLWKKRRSLSYRQYEKKLALGMSFVPEWGKFHEPRGRGPPDRKRFAGGSRKLSALR